MSPLVRRLGVSSIAAALLISGAYKLWSSEVALVAAGALLGAGLVVLGISVREWVRQEPREEES